MAKLLNFGSPEFVNLELDGQAVRDHVGYDQRTVVRRLNRETLEDLAAAHNAGQSDLLEIAEERIDQLTDA